MKKLFLLVLIMAMLSTLAFAQDDTLQSGPSEPDDTDIILPDMYFEIEDLSIEEIDAAVPDDDSVVYMAIEIPLPEPGEIKLPPEIFTLPPTDIPIEDASADNTSLYCEGSIGAGTSTNITGDINLYNIGSSPNFRLSYFHDGYDGFAGKAAGMGFLSREELIEAEIGFTKEKLDVKGLLTFNELEDGLQGQADYYSATRRNIGLDSNANRILNENFFLEGDLDIQYTGFNLNSENLKPLAYNLFNLSPMIGIGWNYKKIKMAFEADYFLGTEISQYINQTLSTNLSFTADIINYLKIDSKIGLLWEDFSQLHIPFNLSFSGTGTLIYYNISGGRRFSYTDLSEIWEIAPAASGPLNEQTLSDIPLFDQWFSEGEIKVNLSEDLTISSKLDFSYAANAPKLGGNSDLKGFNSLSSTDTSVCLTVGAGCFWGVNKIFALDFDWNSQVLNDINQLLPRHSFKLALNVDSEDEKMGISMENSFDIYDKQQALFDNSFVPVIGFDGYFTLYEGFMLSFTLSDILANAIDSGRTLWGSYRDKGTVFQAVVKISL